MISLRKVILSPMKMLLVLLGLISAMLIFGLVYVSLNPLNHGRQIVKKEEAIPQNCQYFFDGCNVCWRNQGELSCTERHCVAMSEAKCLSDQPVETKEECEQYGGQWGVWSDKPNEPETCNLPTVDSGKVCDDSDDCQSFCQAPEGSQVGEEVTGECYEYRHYRCLQTVEDGVAGAVACQ